MGLNLVQLCVAFVFLVGAGTGNESFVDEDATCDITNGVCETRCWCNDGYTHVSQTCLAKVGTTCSNTSDCVRDAECTGNTCSCPGSLVPSHNGTVCRAKVGATCNVSIADTCIDNAECGGVNGSETCTCRDRYSVYDHNTLCVGDVGATCEDDNDCTVHSECTGTTGSMSCNCEEKYTSSADNKTCLGFIGAQCSDVVQCLENMRCDNGFCKCKDGYEGDARCTEEEDKLLLPIWAITVICVGGFLVLLAVIVIVICCCRARN